MSIDNRYNRYKLTIFRLVLVLVLLIPAGCTGPMAIRRTHQHYNEAIQKTGKEQLLLNLVRLRYLDVPTILAAESLTTQFSFDRGAGVDGSVIEGSLPNGLDLGISTSAGETPTVSYRPLRGSEYIKELVTPMKPEDLIRFIESGWSIERVLQIAAQEVNGIPNAPTASGPTPLQAPNYQEFDQLLDLLRELQVQGNIELGYVQEQKKISGTALTAQVTSEDLVNAAKNGFRFEQVDGQIHLEQTVSTLKMRPVEPSDPEQFSYLSELLGSDLLAEDGTKVSIEPRSLLGAMYYLSHVISVPREHCEAGLIPVTVDELNQPFDWTQVAGNLLRVCVQKHKPKCSYVAVEYRGYWYYIPDDHLSSKATFTFLAALLELQAGGTSSAPPPTLTIPVGG